jgi:hypothetical protein
MSEAAPIPSDRDDPERHARYLMLRRALGMETPVHGEQPIQDAALPDALPDRAAAGPLRIPLDETTR